MTRSAILRGWGRSGVPGREVLSEDLESLTVGAVLTRGLGRAYGDAALPPEGVEEVAGSRRANRILGLDEATGMLRAEAGLSLLDLNRLLLPQGWFVPVSPGTQHVTLGGMVAADVHGKNHHRSGTIGRHVSSLRLRVPDGRVLEVSREVEAELFRATLGGMGLTGHVLEVALAMEPVPGSSIVSESRRFPRLEPLAEALVASGREWPLTAAWVDGLATGASLGRGVLLVGRWAEDGEAPDSTRDSGPLVSVPMDAPSFLLNRASVGAFNALYYRRHSRLPRRVAVSYESFFYPLDVVGSWNRLYGRRGFTQYQCVIPRERGIDGLVRFWRRMHELGGWPFLVVLKDFGAEGEGILSFPRPGFTLALDFPLGAGTGALVAGLNREARTLGGRIYLAKDALSTAEDFLAMEGERVQRFREVKRRWDPQNRVRSRLSDRLGLGP